MGFFGGGGNSGAQEPSASDQLISQQFMQNQAEIEQKKKALYQQRLDIIKSQGKQSWTPNKKSPLDNSTMPSGRGRWGY